MSSSIFGIAVSGLNAAQAGLQTAGQNITNVNTPGYSRQQIVQAAQQPQYDGAAGFLGSGVSVSNVQRVYSAFLTGQAWQAQSATNQLQSFSTQIGQVDSLLGSTDTGLSSALSCFFASIQTVSTTPSSVSARQNMLSQAQMLAGRFQDIQSQFDAQASNVGNQIGATASQVNSLASQIASLNQKILAANGGSVNQAPNDLLDQRDQLVNTLSTLVNVQVTTASDGTYNVLIGTGQPLVLGGVANQLTTAAGNPDPAETRLQLKTASGTVTLGSNTLSGGQLGGLLSFRDSVLNPAQNALGRIADTLAAAVNSQNQLGQDLNGNLGSAIFTLGSPTVLPDSGNTGTATVAAGIANYGALTTSDYQLGYDGTNYSVKRLSDGTTSTFATLPQTVDGVNISIASGSMAAGDSFLIEPTRNGAASIGVAIGDPSQIAAALPVQASVPTGNTGSVSAAALSVNGPPPTNANLRQPVTITFTSPTTFNVTGTGTGSPTGVAYTPGGGITYNGWTVQLSGTPAAGDTVSIGSNTGASGDNRNLLAMGNLQNAQLLGNGTATLADGYAQLVSQVGNQAQDAQTGITAQTAVLNNLNQSIQGVSGVNLDEEAANLLRYQQAYQASGKIISIAETMFNTLLSLGQ